MKTPIRALIIIFIVTLLSMLVSVPENMPIKFDIGPLHVDRVLNPPVLSIPQLGISKTFTTHLGLDLKGGVQLVLEADMSDIKTEDKARALESVKEVVERRVNFFGVSEPIVQTSVVGESHRVIVELPGVTNVTEAIQTVGQTAKLEFRESINASASAMGFYTLATTKETGLSGKDLQKADVIFDSKTAQPVVSFELSNEGGQKFSELTKRLKGQALAIFLDSSLVSAPTVNEQISGGKGVISGNFTQQDAKNLALVLSAGALPTPIKIIEQRTIGATLGAASVQKSVYAGLLGLTLVALFMIVYYGLLGFIAVVGLLIYGVVTFALFRLIPVTLTLPGIAGFILSIGMAVDSNILIFARLKEEMRKGKPAHIAMEIAFGRAWDSIRDANVTTILTAIILYNPLNSSWIPVSGLVRGFALTLLLGVGVGLFTGIFVTRNLLRAYWRPLQKVRSIV